MRFEKLLPPRLPLRPEGAGTAHFGDEVGVVRGADLRRHVAKCWVTHAVEAGCVTDV
jgi:hypothetical protein